MDDTNGAIGLDLVEKTDQNLVKITADDIDGEGSVIADTATGFVTAWTQYSTNGSRDIGELYYLQTDQAGTPQGLPQRMIDNSSAVYATFDENPSIDVAPNGRIGIFWKRYLENSLGQYNTNLYFAILDTNGSLLYGPTNITNYTQYGNYMDGGFIEFSDPVMAATLDNHYFLVWQNNEYSTEGPFAWTSIYSSVRDMNNSIIKSPSMISTTYSDSEPTVESFSLRNDRVIVAYTNDIGMNRLFDI